jgi:hypothetical protein
LGTSVWEALAALPLPNRIFFAVALAVAFGFEFINGFHDTANAVTTFIGSCRAAPWGTHGSAGASPSRKSPFRNRLPSCRSRLRPATLASAFPVVRSHSCRKTPCRLVKK